jgi:hypothetical protein
VTIPDLLIMGAVPSATSGNVRSSAAVGVERTWRRWLNSSAQLGCTRLRKRHRPLGDRRIAEYRARQ